MESQEFIDGMTRMVNVVRGTAELGHYIRTYTDEEYETIDKFVTGLEGAYREAYPQVTTKEGPVNGL